MNTHRTRTVRERITVGYRLTKQSLPVFAREPKLLVFPLAAALGSLVIFTVGLPELFGLASFLVVGMLGVPTGGSSDPLIAYLTVFFLWAAVLVVLSACNVGLIYCVDTALAGDPPRLSAGVWAVTRTLPAILLYAVLLAAVGTILRAIERRTGLRLLASLVGFSVTLLTFFVLPIATLDRSTTVLGTYRRSAELFSRTWGETTAVRLGTLLVSMLPVSGLLAAFYAFLFLDGALLQTGITATVLDSTPTLIAIGALVGLSLLVGNTVTTVVKVALYRYALEKDPVVFDTDTASNLPNIDQAPTR